MTRHLESSDDESSDDESCSQSDDEVIKSFSYTEKMMRVMLETRNMVQDALNKIVNLTEDIRMVKQELKSIQGPNVLNQRFNDYTTTMENGPACVFENNYPLPVESQVNSFESQVVDYRSAQKGKYTHSPLFETNTALDKTPSLNEYDSQISNYRAKHQENVQSKSEAMNNRMNNQGMALPEEEHNEDQLHSVVIGDSMIKNIDPAKLSTACQGKVKFESISGATVQDVQNKIISIIQNHGCTESVIFHVGTNDLTKNSTETVIHKMESLIDQIKPYTNSIAMSSVIRRNDGKVSNRKVSSFNDMSKQLCQKLNVYFIDNDNINLSHLNGSKLHLNAKGTKELGRKLCGYIRNQDVKGSVDQSFQCRFTNHKPLINHVQDRPRSWQNYLKFVSLTMSLTMRLPKR
jgi:hypothetical protein